MTIRTDLPSSHVQEAMQLEAKGLVSLYQLELTNPGTQVTLHLSPTNQKTWQSRTWEAVPCTLAGVGVQSTGEMTRPKFSVVNPGGVFSGYVHSKWLDNAIISRYRVLTTDVAANNNVYQISTWRVSKVLSLSRVSVTVELRSVMDGQNFTLPARRFFPPEFPHVSIQ